MPNSWSFEASKKFDNSIKMLQKMIPIGYVKCMIVLSLMMCVVGFEKDTACKGEKKRDGEDLFVSIWILKSFLVKPRTVGEEL